MEPSQRNQILRQKGYVQRLLAAIQPASPRIIHRPYAQNPIPVSNSIQPLIAPAGLTICIPVTPTYPKNAGTPKRITAAPCPTLICLHHPDIHRMSPATFHTVTKRSTNNIPYSPARLIARGISLKYPTLAAGAAQIPTGRACINCFASTIVYNTTQRPESPMTAHAFARHNGERPL